MFSKDEKEKQENSLDLAKRIINSIKPEDLATAEEKIICTVCGHANLKSDGMCKKCSNLLFN